MTHLPVLPQEMIVTTNLLDFLEQALEKVDLNQLINRGRSKSNPAEPQTPDELEMSSMSVAASRDGQLSNFPVDIIVYCNVLPSTIRFRLESNTFVNALDHALVSVVNVLDSVLEFVPASVSTFPLISRTYILTHHASAKYFLTELLAPSTMG